MAGALSQDLRSRVIAAVDGGMSRNSAAARFGVAVSTAVRWLRTWREHDRPTALPVGGDKRSHRIEAFGAVILAAIEAQKDITLAELAELLHGDYGASFAISTIWRFLDRHDVTFKKNGTRQRAGTPRCPGPAPRLVRRST
ncbi:helix-turn-helix domain-containing protein, partial [Acidisphaera sp. L21]|jgi:transposase|uniref:helix-turn-helix domain-containing protein n=1 Tax=Acidisphaera sp. L21 TaxID=1641851 RepID=UPI0038D2090D